MLLLRAAHVIPQLGPTLRDGAVLCQRGVIVAVDRYAALAGAVPLGTTTHDLGAAVLMPGFVNAHCHLELTGLAGAIPPGLKFTEWVRRVIAGRERLEPQGCALAAVGGADELLASGTTTVADTFSVDAVDEALVGHPLRRVAFGEVLGLGRRLAAGQARLAALTERIAAVGCDQRSTRYGLAPHAPYSTAPELCTATVAAAHALGVAVSTHLAETLEELAFLTRGDGPLRDLLTDVGALLAPVDDGIIEQNGTTNTGRDWFARPSAVAWLAQAGGLGPQTLIVHLNHPTAEDLTLIAKARATVVVCPGTHEYFSRGRLGFRELLDAGIPVAVGTDSAASSPDGRLSVLGELRRLRRMAPSLRPEVLLAMATTAPAEALGLAGRLGALTPGAWADMVAFPCSQGGASEALDVILHGEVSPLVVYVAGQQTTSYYSN